MFVALPVNVGVAVAEELKLPCDRIWLGKVFRSLRYFKDEVNWSRVVVFSASLLVK